MIVYGITGQHYEVAPLVGAWIEILWRTDFSNIDRVAPLVGAWIEIDRVSDSSVSDGGRSSCRSVD